MLIVKDWINLATDLKKLATHKCIATPWLRTTDLWSITPTFYDRICGQYSCAKKVQT